METPRSHPLLDGLNPAQREAVTCIDGPLMVLAGAGSGKTRVITHRIAWMIEHGVPPSAILAVTFTNKAAGEMRERVRRMTGHFDVLLSTFHAFCATLLRQDFPSAGRSGDFTIYDDDDKKALLKRLIDAHDLDPKRFTVNQLRERIGRWKNLLVLPEEALAEAPAMGNETEARLYQAYDAALFEANACDFDDLLTQTVILLREQEDVRERWRRRLTHFLVDEFQDTNPVQYALIRTLSAHTHNLCVTGDPDQSIYSWRGADPRGFDHFLEEHEGARTVALEENYRSTEHILTGASTLIAHNRNRLPKRLFTRQEGGEAVRVVAFGDEYEEARAIALAIREWEAEGYTPGQVAVFYRTNDLSFAIERMMVQEGIPYQVVGGLEFFARQEVKDILAYLRFLANPQDIISGMRILNVPSRGIGKKTQDQVLEVARAEGRTLGEALREPELFTAFPRRARESLVKFAGQLVELDGELPRGQVGPLIKALLDITGYHEYWKNKATRSGSLDPDRNIGQLVNFAMEFDDLKGGSLTAFLEQLALMADVDRFKESVERVSLMTLHTSKGLEFDAVVVVGVEEGLLPHAMSFGDPEGKEEERRLLHVGMTRARQRLVLTWTKRRTRFGRVNASLPSPFLDEIGTDGIERFGEWGTVGSGTSPSSVSDFSSADDFSFDDDVFDDHPLVRLNVGSRVHHGDYGAGTVTRISGRGRGLNRKVVIAFDDQGTRTLILEHSGLELLEDGEEFF